MAASESTQYQITKQGGPWASVSVPKPTPGPGEVTIRQKSIALNPLDFKQAFFGAMVQSWPATLGIDGAGIVEAVGEGVTKVKPGDEVFAFFKGLSYQEVAPTIAAFTALKPKSLSFDEAATLGCTYCTAAATITSNLKIPLPFIPGAASAGAKPSSILVLGGSSGVGAAAIQLLRQALPDATILTTSSAKNHAHLVSLGATKAFDQNSSSLVDDIKAATPDGKGVDMIADTVGSGAQQKSIFDALSPDGLREYAAVATGMQFEAPEGVKFSTAFAGTILQTQGGENVMEGLVNLINEGKYKVAQTVKNVGNGFDAIPNGLAELKAGVSMTKLVVSV